MTPQTALPRRTKTGLALLFAGILTAGSGLSVGTAMASGESVTAVLSSPVNAASSTFVWTYRFDRNGGHGLSNIAVAFCNDAVLRHVVSAPGGEVFAGRAVPGGHDGFGPGIKFNLTAVTGSFTVVFDRPYAPGGEMKVQSHSGNGSDGDLITEATGPDACDGEPTTTRPPVTLPEPPVTTTTIIDREVPVTTTTSVVQPRVTTTIPDTTVPPGVTTTVPGVTIDPQTTTTVETQVLGNRFVQGNRSANAGNRSLAKTGSGTIGLLVGLGIILALIGLALLAGGRISARSTDG